MKFEICVSHPDDVLEKYRPTKRKAKWNLVVSGRWCSGMYHSGFIAYYVAKLKAGSWVLDAVEWNGELDGVTEEEVEEGCLNDDQAQALWGSSSLREAQEQEYRRIVAVCSDIPRHMGAKEVGDMLYKFVCLAGGKEIDEPD